MRLISLALDNFKGIRHFEITPNGSNMDVFGSNGAGKTTLADAYFWLLFGKDSAGRSDSNFDVIPLGADGLDCSVRGVFRRETGEEFSLRRIYKQVYTRKNGEADREYKGNTTDFYINDVPKPKKDYTAFISDICDESTLMLLTDPDRFPGKLRWDERRDMLIRQFTKAVDDRKIIQVHEELTPLLSLIGLKSVDDYAAISRERRKAINRELSDIPGRIDEAEKAKPLEAAPLPTDGPRFGQLTVEKARLEEEISRVRSGESAATMRKEIAEMEAQLATAGANYTRQIAGSLSVSEELSDARSKRMRLSTNVSDHEYRLSSLIHQIEDLDKKLAELRQACIDNFHAEFDSGDGLCPTCGQTFPASHFETLHSDWNEQKATRQEMLEMQGVATKAKLDKLTAEAESERAAMIEDEKQLRDTESTIRTIEKNIQQPPAWETTPQYEAMIIKLSEKRQQLSELQNTMDFHITRIREQLKVIDEEMASIQTRQVSRGIVEQQDMRIRHLKAEEKRLAVELAEIDNGLRLADEFVQAKASDIEESVNSAFRTVRWKLFDRQINGGVKACCEATVNGIEYGTNLNNAARLNAGLDIISALSGKMDVSFPIWIDNAESVTDYLPVQSQVIRLFVSAADKQLRTEDAE